MFLLYQHHRNRVYSYPSKLCLAFLSLVPRFLLAAHAILMAFLIRIGGRELTPPVHHLKIFAEYGTHLH